MSCCGSKRESLKQSFNAVKQSSTVDPLPMWSDVLFEYSGPHAATYKGSVTGKRYHFSFAGEQQLIDYRDAGGMRAEPFLKKAVM